LAVRIAGWCAFAAELAVFVFFLPALAERRDLWLTYLGSLAGVVGFCYFLPRWLGSWMGRPEAWLGREGNRWRVGKYDEALVRRVVEEATQGLPAPLRRLRVRITKDRFPTAWTRLSLVWPVWNARKDISITSGSLHYLEPDELQAVLLHEIGHHDRQNRIDAPGGWLAAEAAFHATAFWAFMLTNSAEAGVCAFLAARWLAVFATANLVVNHSRAIEHLCDLFAARRIGSPPIINALLKGGEEEELTEAVLVWAARELRDKPDVDHDLLGMVFADVRPYGRIFHENLIRHADAVVKEVARLLRLDKKRPKAGYRNHELEQLVENRRAHLRRRIRWRRFDRNGDGRLQPGEIAELCRELRSHPDHVLVLSEHERQPAMHPPFRERVLLLADADLTGAIGASMELRAAGSQHSVARKGLAPSPP